MGIGTTSPTNDDFGSLAPKLHVKQSDTSGAFNLVARFQAGNDANDTGGAILINHSNDRGLLIEGGRGGAGTIPDDDAVSHLGLVQSNGTNTRVITLRQRSASNSSLYGVGIGTTSPQKLDVEGGALGSTSGDSTTAAIIRAGRQNLIFKDTRTADGTDWNNATFKVIAAIDTTSHQSIDFVNDSGYLEHIDLRVGNQVFSTRFASNGNVGIGTTSPGHLLEVRGTSDALSVGDDTNTQTYMRFAGSRTMFGYTGADAAIQGGSGKGIRFNVNDDSFNSGTAMYINSSGNVGIGVTTPTHKLHVNGNMRLTGALRDSNNAPGSAGQVLSSTGSATDWIPLPATPTIYTPKVYNLNNSTNINSQGQKLVPDFGTLEIEGNTTIQQVSNSDTDFQVTDENTGIYEVTYAVFYKNTGNQRTPLGTYLTLNGTAVNGSLMVNYVRSNVTGGGNFSSCTNTFYVNVTDASHPMALCVRRADSSTAPSGFSMVEPAGMAVKSTISFRRIS